MDIKSSPGPWANLDCGDLSIGLEHRKGVKPIETPAFPARCPLEKLDRQLRRGLAAGRRIMIGVNERDLVCKVSPSSRAESE